MIWSGGRYQALVDQLQRTLMSEQEQLTLTLGERQAALARAQQEQLAREHLEEVFLKKRRKKRRRKMEENGILRL